MGLGRGVCFIWSLCFSRVCGVSGEQTSVYQDESKGKVIKGLIVRFCKELRVRLFLLFFVCGFHQGSSDTYMHTLMHAHIHTEHTFLKQVGAWYICAFVCTETVGVDHSALPRASG